MRCKESGRIKSASERQSRRGELRVVFDANAALAANLLVVYVLKPPEIRVFAPKYQLF
jgi:hypothetical protein